MLLRPERQTHAILTQHPISCGIKPKAPLVRQKTTTLAILIAIFRYRVQLALSVGFAGPTPDTLKALCDNL